MSLEDVFEASAKWLNICCSSVNNAELLDSTRNRVSAALFHLCLEHHGAIHLLASNKPDPHYGSAFALFRPQFESFIRGIWYYKCATDQQLLGFTKGEEPPRINDLITAIEKTPNYDSGELAKFKTDTWSILCSYTHGGSVQVASFTSLSKVGNNFTEDQVVELISKVCAVTLVVIIEYMTLVGKEQYNEELLYAYKEIFS